MVPPLNPGHPSGNNGQPVKIRPYTTKELCTMYEITGRTFNTWLLPFKGVIGKRMGYYYTILQVERIFEKLGSPKE